MNGGEWECLNVRRIELLDRDIDGLLSEPEKAELGKLEHIADEVLKELSPFRDDV